MYTLTTPSTKVAEHVATHRRPVPPAFVSRYSAERYRQAVLDEHTQQARQEPEAPEVRAAIERAAVEHAAFLTWLADADRRARTLTVVGMALVLVLAIAFR